MPPATISEWTWPEKPWHRLHLDLAGPFMGRMFLVLVDAYSKWIEIFIIKDNGRQFVSGEFEQFTKMNGIRHTKTSPYNPSTNGLAERYVREFKNLLRKNNGKDDLETNLQSFLFAHRAFPQTVIKEFAGGTANEEKFKIKILEFNTKMGNPREVFHEAGEIKFESLSKLTYMDQVINESLRLYPPSH
ncbi:K02A2.6-like, partial [Cordylochernes scorpioides]